MKSQRGCSHTTQWAGGVGAKIEGEILGEYQNISFAMTNCLESSSCGGITAKRSSLKLGSEIKYFTTTGNRIVKNTFYDEFGHVWRHITHWIDEYYQNQTLGLGSPISEGQIANKLLLIHQVFRAGANNLIFCDSSHILKFD